jgi:hypothetical protein
VQAGLPREVVLGDDVEGRGDYHILEALGVARIQVQYRLEASFLVAVSSPLDRGIVIRRRGTIPQRPLYVTAEIISDLAQQSCP